MTPKHLSRSLMARNGPAHLGTNMELISFLGLGLLTAIALITTFAVDLSSIQAQTNEAR